MIPLVGWLVNQNVKAAIYVHLISIYLSKKKYKILAHTFHIYLIVKHSLKSVKRLGLDSVWKK